MAGRSIIVDTSSIIFGLSKKHDVFGKLAERFPGYGISISQGIMNEIKGIAGGSGRYSKSAKVALELIKKNKSIEIDGSRKYPDDWMVDKASEDMIICTNDTALKKRLREKGAAVISISINGILR